VGPVLSPSAHSHRERRLSSLPDASPKARDAPLGEGEGRTGSAVVEPAVTWTTGRLWRHVEGVAPEQGGPWGRAEPRVPGGAGGATPWAGPGRKGTEPVTYWVESLQQLKVRLEAVLQEGMEGTCACSDKPGSGSSPQGFWRSKHPGTRGRAASCWGRWRWAC